MLLKLIGRNVHNLTAARPPVSGILRTCETFELFGTPESVHDFHITLRPQ